jgi:menaquinone-specific isochorismate synthase
LRQSDYIFNGAKRDKESGGKLVSIVWDKVLYESLKEGIARCRETLQTVIVSKIKKVNYIDPISLFKAGKYSFFGERFYWSEPSRDMYIVGIGHAYTINAEAGNQRFIHMKDQWQQFAKRHILMSGCYPLVYGTGPILLGGFSFDPYQQKTALWKNFASGKMILPCFMLTVTKEQVWLTTNMIVHRHDNPDEKLAWMEEQERSLFKNPSNSPIRQNLKLKELEINSKQWIDSVAKVSNDIRDGLVDKVVLARELRLKATNFIQVEDVLNRLHKEQPASYIFAVEIGNHYFIGASPERLVKKKETECLSMCLAGTIARGKSAAEDVQLGHILLQDKKNLHEHSLAVKLIKAGMKEGCNEIIIPENPILYKLRDVQHLYTPVIGLAKDNITLLDMVEKLHPTPALGGYPRDKALEIIREVENLDRGWYAGPVGWVNIDGDGEFAVAIRSGLVQGKSASLFAGCGIVGESDPNTEYIETQMKFKPMLSALRG